MGSRARTAVPHDGHCRSSGHLHGTSGLIRHPTGPRSVGKRLEPRQVAPAHHFNGCELRLQSTGVLHASKYGVAHGLHTKCHNHGAPRLRTNSIRNWSLASDPLLGGLQLTSSTWVWGRIPLRMLAPDQRGAKASILMHRKSVWCDRSSPVGGLVSLMGVVGQDEWSK